MRQKQDQDKRDLVEAQRSMSSIEAKAQRQYEADKRAAQESLKQRLGEWVSVHAATNLQARQLCHAVLRHRQASHLHCLLRGTLLLICVLTKSRLGLFLHTMTNHLVTFRLLGRFVQHSLL